MDEVIEELRQSGLKEHIFLYEPKEKMKKKMVKCLFDNFQNDVSATEGFNRTLTTIEDFFCN